MRVFLPKLLGLALMAFVASSCSIQRRTVLPGFHIERMHKTTASAALNQSSSPIVEEMPRLEVGRLDQTLIPSIQHIEQRLDAPHSGRLAAFHKVRPRALNMDLDDPELLEPQPWDEAYRQQKFFGKLALGLLCLALGLVAAGVGHPVAFVAYFMAQFVNRRKAKKVLDIKEAHGVDVDEDRKRLKRSNLALGGAAFASVAVAAIVAVLTVLLFIMVVGLIISFFTSL